MKQGRDTALLITDFILAMTTTIPPTIVPAEVRYLFSSLQHLQRAGLQEEDNFSTGVSVLSIMEDQFVALGESLLGPRGDYGAGWAKLGSRAQS